MQWRIGEILIQKKLIDWEQLEEALLEQGEAHCLVGEILVRKRFISKTLLYGALAKQYDMQYVDPERIHINPKTIECIPRSIAQKYSLLPIDICDNVLFMGLSDPKRKWPKTELKELTKVQDIKTVLCLPEAIARMIDKLYASEKG